MTVPDGLGESAPARKATVYQRAGRLFVNRVDTTRDGIPVTTADVIALELEVDDRLLGKTVLELADRARDEIEPIRSTEWGHLSEPLYRAAGVGSWKAFVRGCRDVSVFVGASGVTLIPSRNLGETEGFEGLNSHTIVVPRHDPSIVGCAVRAALKQSTPH